MAKKDLAYFKKRLARIRYYVSETLELRKKVLTADTLLEGVVVTPEMQARVDYYCQLNAPFTVSDHAVRNDQFVKTKSFVYFADLKRVMRHFAGNYRFDYLFGDIVDVPEVPTFVKSRPINDNNQNAILLKLNAIRHYQFHEDHKAFSDKLPMAVWRGMVYHQHRRDFVDRYYDNAHVDVGHNDESLAHEAAFKGFMSIKEQLEYRYIVSIEGKDVATNLKWAMASSSLVLMRKPRFETWFMEGRLVAGEHYVELKDDFSDLEEKIAYFNQPENADEALSIIANANRYVEQFKNHEKDHELSLLVAHKYFQLQQKSS